MDGLQRINAVRRNMEVSAAYDARMKTLNACLMKDEITVQEYNENKEELDARLDASLVVLD